MTVERFAGDSGVEWSYDTDRQLGESGGFGAVYAGKDSTGRLVAVKRVPLGPPDPVPPPLRLREVEIAAKLEPGTGGHLLPALDVAQTAGHLLIVMDRAECALSDRIGSGMAEMDALEVLRDITAGLMELHALAILHRDLKPKNVLLLDGFGSWPISASPGI
jgi:serine/threonine protein kinase